MLSVSSSVLRCNQKCSRNFFYLNSEVCVLYIPSKLDILYSFSRFGASWSALWCLCMLWLLPRRIWVEMLNATSYFKAFCIEFISSVIEFLAPLEEEVEEPVELMVKSSGFTQHRPPQYEDKDKLAARNWYHIYSPFHLFCLMGFSPDVLWNERGWSARKLSGVRLLCWYSLCLLLRVWVHEAPAKPWRTAQPNWGKLGGLTGKLFSECNPFTTG